MNSEPDRRDPVQCTLHSDPRLIPGVAAIAAHVAQRAGLSDRAQGDVAAAAVEACCEMFLLARGHGDSNPRVRISAQDFRDRVEMTIEFSDGIESPGGSRGRHKAPATAPENLRKPLEGVLVDRVRWESAQDRSRVTLVKYSAVAKSGQKV